MTISMPRIAELTELELKLINALQIDPRASWTGLGEALGLDPSTAGRAWQGLSGSGRAWVSAYPRTSEAGIPFVAFIEVVCRGGATGHVAEVLAMRPWAATIEHTTGGRDLLVSAVVTTLSALSRLLAGDLDAVDGVVSTRVHVATTVLVEGAGWRLHAVSADAARRLSRRTSPKSPGPTALDPRDAALVHELGLDGRAGFSDMAAATGMGISTVRRRVHRLVDSGAVSLRCEVAQPLSGWPVSAAIWCRVPPARLERVMSGFSGLPEIRLCAAITGGPTNLFLSLWLRTPGDLQRLEVQLGERVPEVEVVDRVLALRHVKRMGHILDRHGRSVAVVPVAAL